MKGFSTTQHFYRMKPILLLPLLAACAAQADPAEDRAAIDKLILALNEPAHRVEFFTKDAHSSVDFDRLIDLHSRRAGSMPDVFGMEESWTVLTVPRVVSGPIHFLGRKAATVDGASTIDGAVTLARRVPLVFLVKKQHGEWRIAAVHVGTAPTTTPAK